MNKATKLIIAVAKIIKAMLFQRVALSPPKGHPITHKSMSMTANEAAVTSRRFIAPPVFVFYWLVFWNRYMTVYSTAPAR